jgi:hypothetical protein
LLSRSYEAIGCWLLLTVVRHSAARPRLQLPRFLMTPTDSPPAVARSAYAREVSSKYHRLLWKKGSKKSPQELKEFNFTLTGHFPVFISAT